MTTNILETIKAVEMVSRKLNIEFNAIKKDILEAYIAVGMITDKQYDFFIRNTTNASTISIITGVHMPTPPSIFTKLKAAEAANNLTARIYVEKYFHPKLYLFHLTNKSWIAFVGSGNFTNGGWFENEELFITVTHKDGCEALKNEFDKWHLQSKEITEDFINYYTSTFTSNEPKQKETRKNIQQLLDHLNNKFNIENIDFTDQFFTREHHEAFAPGKTHLETPEILEERRQVRNRLYDLNDLLVDAFHTDWHINPHYEREHIVSHIENNFHHDFNVKALWVGYGRNRQMLKQYGDWATPLKFMRMQVIIGYDYIGTWLMPGKIGEGQVDREYFLKNMANDEGYRNAFFDLLNELGSNYWIEIADDEKIVTTFQSANDLWEYAQKDNWRYYYFIIGRNYSLGSHELKDNNIEQTVIDDFAKFYPIYEMMRDKTTF